MDGKVQALSIGNCSLLVGLRSSSQPLDQLVLTLRELWRISWRLREVMKLVLSALRRLSIWQVVGK